MYIYIYMCVFVCLCIIRVSCTPQKGRALHDAGRRRPLLPTPGFDSRSVSEIFGGQSGTVTGFSPSTWVYGCHYHSTIAPHLHLHIALTRTNGLNLGTFQKAVLLSTSGHIV
jgi:hypothetical protein